MGGELVPDALREFVKRRARHTCEYCLLPQSCTSLTHEMDHIIAVKHRGPTKPNNLALACFACSRHKSCNISGVDPDTGKIVRLFNPRKHKWSVHFGRFWLEKRISAAPQSKCLKSTFPIGSNCAKA